MNKTFQKTDRVRVNRHYLDDFLDEGYKDDSTIASFVGKEGTVIGNYRYIAVFFDDGDEGFFTEKELDLISKHETEV